MPKCKGLMLWIGVFALFFLVNLSYGKDISEVFCEDIIQIGSNCTMHTPQLSCTGGYIYSIINLSDGAYIVKNNTLVQVNPDFQIYKLNFTNITHTGNYIVRLCDGSTRGIIIKEGAEREMIIAIIMLLPMILSIAFLVGAATLDSEEHNALKIFLFLLSIIPFFISMHIGMVSLVKFYDFPELQNIIGSSVYWFGILFGVIVTYFIIYLFYMMVHAAAQKKKEKMRY